MATRCKYSCHEVTKRKHWDKAKGHIFTAKFSPVMDGSEENKKFYAATPSGSLEVGTYQQDIFEVGKDYFIDISEAPAEAAAP